MTCRQVRELLSSYLDDELEPQKRHLVQEHVRKCVACRKILDELLTIKRALGSLPEIEPPLELHDKIMRAIKIKKLKTARLGQGLFSKDNLTHNLKRWGTVLVASLLLIFISSFSTFWYINSRQGLKLSESLVKSDVSLQEKTQAGEGRALLEQRSGNISAESEKSFEPLSGVPSDTGEAVIGSVQGVQKFEAEEFWDIDRKIIQRAYVSLEVARGGVQEASMEAIRIVERNQGYVASSTMSQGSGSKNKISSFYMTAKIPRENLSKTIQEISVLGKLVKKDLSTQDVTQEYVDLEARIRNKEVQEQRLLKILGEAKTVGEILQVENELSRVRSDIESMKSRKEVLKRSSDYSSLSLAINEEGTVGPKLPSPWQDIWRAFAEAWRKLFIFLATVAPAAITIGVAVFAVTRMVRREK